MNTLVASSEPDEPEDLSRLRDFINTVYTPRTEHARGDAAHRQRWRVRSTLDRPVVPPEVA